VLVSSLAFKGIAEYLVIEAPGSPPVALQVLDKLVLCLVIFSAVELIKTLAARLLSLRIHSEALFDSLEVLCSLVSVNFVRPRLSVFLCCLPRLAGGLGIMQAERSCWLE
jgi:hypothetical protein